MFRHHLYGPAMGMGHGGLILGVLKLVFWGLVIWLIVSLLRHSHHFNGRYSHQDPLDMAKVRSAKGEMTKAEFEQIKKDLKD
jgi:uncharacterized membrane protein